MSNNIILLFIKITLFLFNKHINEFSLMYMKKITLNNDTFFLKIRRYLFLQQHLTTFDNGLYPS